MPSGVKLAAQSAGTLAYFKVLKAEVIDFAGPMLNRREVEIPQAQFTHEIYVDFGYPFREAGNCHAWQFYHANAGFVDIGDMYALIMRNVAGSLTVITDGVLPMTQVMDGEGIWTHPVTHGGGAGGSVPVQAGDFIGFYVGKVPSGSGILPRWRFDVTRDETIGAYRINLLSGTAAPVAGSSYPIVPGDGGFDEAYLVPRRLPIQARGAGTGALEALSYEGPLQAGTPTATEDPYVRGDGPIIAPTVSALGASGTAPEAYIYDTVGSVPSNLEVGQLFNLDGETGLTTADGAQGSIALRLINGAAVVRVLHSILGTSFSPRSANGAGMQIGLYYAVDAAALGGDARPDLVTDWVKFYQSPDDAHGSDLTFQLTDQHHHVQLFKRAKWVRLDYVNATGSTRDINSFLNYTAETAIAGDQYIPNFQDQNPEYFFATAEGSTFLLTVDVVASAVLTFGQADTEDFAGLAAGHSIWQREGTTFARHEIQTFDAVAKTITLTAPVTVSAGAFFDTRNLALRVDGYNAAAQKIQESPPLLVAGLHQERFFKVHVGADPTGMP